MQITAIQQQVKNKSRYSIYIDGKYSFSLSEQGLLSSGIVNGMELTSQQLDELRDASVFDKAYARSLNLLARRARSEWEIRDYLRRKDYDLGLIDQLVEKLVSKGYIDDHDFAQRWVENRRLLKQTSKRKLWQELKQKRVADNVITEVLESDETDEKQVILELALRKQKTSRYKDRQKLMQYLSRQGFRYDDITWALSQITEEA